MTATIFIVERKAGLLDRSLVAGTSRLTKNEKKKYKLTTTSILSRSRSHVLLFLHKYFDAGVQMLDIMLAHVANQFIVLLGQTALVFLFVLLVFKITCHGSLVLAVILSLVQGLVGLCFGKFEKNFLDEWTN